MRLSEVRWIADENIQSQVVDFLRQLGWDLESIQEKKWTSMPDVEILRYATQNKLGIITQDIDFGELIFKNKEPFHAVLRFWPGHYAAEVMMDHLPLLQNLELEVVIPFMVTAHIQPETLSVGVRIRQF